MTVLCLAERDGAAIEAGSAAALAFAQSLGEPVTAVVFGAGPVSAEPAADLPAGLVAELAAAGAAAIGRVAAPGLTGYAPLAWARSLHQLAAACGASAVIVAGTDRGGEVLAHLGAISGLPVAANCVAVSASGPGRWQLVRQRWAGSVLEDAVLEAPVALLTVAADAVRPADGVPAVDGLAAADGAAVAGSGPGLAAASGAQVGGTAPAIEISTFTPELAESDLLVQARETAADAAGASLATARVVVGGGRGVGGADGFAALEELAALLGGVVGVSRVVTSAGWRPHRQQVGQTGTKISPELYVACGISGAIQHMAGCQNARHIIAINTDANAPIVGRAEYAVVGDLHEVIPALVAAIKAAQAPA
jgi:electron transfer flavoprotein alpha subunit